MLNIEDCIFNTYIRFDSLAKGDTKWWFRLYRERVREMVRLVESADQLGNLGNMGAWEQDLRWAVSGGDPVSC